MGWRPSLMQSMQTMRQWIGAAALVITKRYRPAFLLRIGKISIIL